MTTARPLHLIGTTNSVVAYRRGGDSPESFCRHGPVVLLESAGRMLVNVGDVAFFREDFDHVQAANVDAVAEVCRAVASPVAEALDQGALAHALGGGCTVEFCTSAGKVGSRVKLR